MREEKSVFRLNDVHACLVRRTTAWTGLERTVAYPFREAQQPVAFRSFWDDRVDLVALELPFHFGGQPGGMHDDTTGESSPTQAANEGRAVEQRHLLVSDQQIETGEVACNRLPGRLTIGHTVHFVPGILKVQGDQVRVDRLILSAEDLQQPPRSFLNGPDHGDRQRSAVWHVVQEKTHSECVYEIGLFRYDEHLRPSIPRAFGRVLRSHRERRKWSQLQLAEKADLHLNTIGMLERGERGPSLETVFLFCEIFDVSVDRFMAAVAKELKAG